LKTKSYLLRTVLAAAAALGGFAWTSGAIAQDEYPNKPVTLVIPYAPGGGTDAVARVVAQKLGEVLKQPVVAENRPGATGSLAANLVARATPDGYTLLFGSNGPMSLNPVFRKTGISYDPIADFAPVALISFTPNVMVVNPQFPVRSAAEFIAMAKAKPGVIDVGTTVGSSPDLMLLLLAYKAGIDFKRVPYASGAPVMNDVLAGHVPAMTDTVTATQQHIAAKTLIPIAVGSAQRSPMLPDVPTFAETIPGFESTVWYGLFAPANTPRPVLAKLNAAINEVLIQEDLKKRFTTLGMIGAGGSQEKLRDYLAAEIAQWKQLAKDTGVTFE
jgi:tripartite-type tricarboxylate transporter receptor subunit TctC